MPSEKFLRLRKQKEVVEEEAEETEEKSQQPEEETKVLRKKGVKRPNNTTLNVPYSQWEQLDKLKKKLKLRRFDQVIQVLQDNYGAD